FLIRIGINAQIFRTLIRIGIRAAALGKATGKFTFRIVGASDKSTETTAAQGQLTLVTTRANARIAAVLFFREQVIGQERVQLCRYFGWQALHDFGGFGFEVMPERFQYFLPLCAAAADIVQLFLKQSRIVIGDIAFKKPLEKSY